MADATDLVIGPSGTVFGVIDQAVAEAIGRPQGPICLPYGIPGARGFGRQHVEGMDGRMRQIKGFGHPSFASYAYFICQEYGWVMAGDNERLKLVRQYKSYDHIVVVQFDAAQGYWSITTGFPSRRPAHGQKLWVREQAGRSEPSPGVVRSRPRLETLTLPKT